MIRHFLSVTLRRLWRGKGSTAIQVTGLVLGLCSATVILSIIRFELSFDAFYPKRDRLAKVVTDEIRDGRSSSTSASPGAIADALNADIAGVEHATLVYVDYGGTFVIHDGTDVRKFSEDHGVARAEPAFFSMFDIPFLEGAPESLRRPNTVVLTEGIARKYFGDISPIGRTIRWENSRDLTVVGVVPDPPVNTHINYTMYISTADLKETDAWLWDWRNLTTNAQTYVLLRPETQPEDIEARMAEFKDRYMQDVVNQKVFRMQRVQDIHFAPAYADGIGRTASRASLWGLGMIGLFLVITACVNYVNMATAQAVTRAREIGVRKVLGTTPWSIRLQFLGETFIIVLLSVVLSVVLADLLVPSLAPLLGVPFEFDALDPLMILYLTALLASVTIVSGSYPALVLGGFQPVVALKGSVSSGGKTMRRALVVVQFAISQMLVAGTLIVISQMDLVMRQDLGLDPDGIVVIQIPEPDAQTVRTLETEFKQQPQVEHVSFSWNTAISGNTWDTNIRYRKDGEEQILNTDLKFADEEYADTYGLRLLAGRMYLPSDTVRELVVNETFVASLGITSAPDAIGMLIKLGRSGGWFPIVGVVRDFNTASLHEKIRPCLLTTRTNRYHEAGLLIKTADMDETLRHIREVWSNAFPNYVFEYEFLNDRIAEFYEQEQRMSLLFRLFASIAVLIGCIGLVGLVSFMAERKTKEIGVRKVLGATTMNILGLFSKEFGRLVFLAFVLAAPISYVVMNSWLENFAFRIQIGPVVFLMTIGLMLVVAAMTVSVRAIRAAAANPVENLRYE